ncbi:hypothetical protein KUCAC02_034822 [Chaenocephalus aceratus]|nr:hypothetical protein KUCAC02_034822 [Chaenocephalus aceratus]
MVNTPIEEQQDATESSPTKETSEEGVEKKKRVYQRSADPYDPRNFTAPLHTATSPPRKIPPSSSDSSPTPPPLSSLSLSPPWLPPPPRRAVTPGMIPPQRYRREEAEERLDSGFSELSVSSSACSVTKKVRFCEEVEEFFASGGGDGGQTGSLGAVRPGSISLPAPRARRSARDRLLSAANTPSPGVSTPGTTAGN